MEFILNNTYGINKIDKIDLKKIINVFGNPDSREIIRESEWKNFGVNYIYKDIDLKIFYNVYYYVNKKGVEFQTLSFIVKKLYLSEELKIENGDDIRKSLEKIRKYYKKNKKEFEFEYEDDEYSGSYDFANLGITVYFEKIKGLKFIEDIYVDLPYEDDPIVLTLDEILYMEK